MSNLRRLQIEALKAETEIKAEGSKKFVDNFEEDEDIEVTKKVVKIKRAKGK